MRSEDAWPLCFASVLSCTLAVWPRMAAKTFSYTHQSEALVNAFQVTACSGPGILIFNDQFASDLPALNGASSPAAAADVYVTDFEHASNPVAGTRESSAEAVAVACHL